MRSADGGKLLLGLRTFAMVESMLGRAATASNMSLPLTLKCKTSHIELDIRIYIVEFMTWSDAQLVFHVRARYIAFPIS